jgi:hypothetical protein
MNRVQTPDHHWLRPPESQPHNLFHDRENLLAARNQHDPARSAIADEFLVRGKGAAALQIANGFFPVERAQHLGRCNGGGNDGLVRRDNQIQEIAGIVLRDVKLQ